MKIEETSPDETGFDPYLVIGECRDGKMEFIQEFGTELAAVTHYERLLKALAESSRSRFSAVRLTRVLRHAEVSPE